MPWRLRVWHELLDEGIEVGRDHLLAPHNALYCHCFHQSLHRAACDIRSFAAKLMPDLAGAIALAALFMDALDFRAVTGIAFGAN